MVKAGKERLLSLDIRRVLAAVAVVLMHTVSGVLNGNFDMTGYERRRRAFLAIMDATAWCVPIFLMISGYFLLNPALKMTWKDALVRYCRRIFLALLFFGVPYALLELVSRERGFRVGMLWEAAGLTATGKTWAHMWYLYLILILYAVTPALRWVLKKLPHPAVCVLLGSIALLASFLPFASELLGWGVKIGNWQQTIYVFYYCMGYVFATGLGGQDKTKEGKSKGEKRNFRGGVICLALFAVILLAEMGSRFLEGYELNMAYAYPPTLLAALLLFGGSLMIGRERAKGDLARDPDRSPKGDLARDPEGSPKGDLARNPEGSPKARVPGESKSGMRRLLTGLVPLTFGIYLIHPVFLNFFYKFMGISIMDFRFFIGVPLFFGISFLGSAFGTWVLRLIPPVKKYVL